jgi:hypothetical protein
MPLASQQPAQFEAAHFGAPHLPFEHSCPVMQAMHIAPAAPQAILSLPPWHILFESQHPVEQFEALH